MLISQDLFDETLLESQELFEYDDDQAVQETISELQSQQSSDGEKVRLDHLSLTHPTSTQGEQDRQFQQGFCQALSDNDVTAAMEIVKQATNGTPNNNGESDAAAIAITTTNKSSKARLPMFASLVLQKGFLQPRSSLMQRLDDSTKEEEEEKIATNKHTQTSIEELLQFLQTILPETATTHPLVRELKLQLGHTLLHEHWFALFDYCEGFRGLLLSLARTCCNGCEANKKTLVQAGIKYHPTNSTGGSSASSRSTLRSREQETGIGQLIHALPVDKNGDEPQAARQERIQQICQLLTVLGRFQVAAEPPPKDGQAPVVSSAHANVKEFYKVGAVPRLHSLAQEFVRKSDDADADADNEQQEAILCDILSALRVMAIDDGLVQAMVGVGILETVNTSNENLRLLVDQPATAAATLGLLRNLSANDDIKTTLCKQSLSAILQAMQSHLGEATLQEHGCGILAAMCLRQPTNAERICRANGPEHIVQAMKAFPQITTLQRQGCLALRNLACRASVADKQVILDAGAEFVLRQIAGRHQESVDEAYAALRDLGCPVNKVTVDEHGKAHGTEVFGTIQSNFRPVYD